MYSDSEKQKIIDSLKLTPKENFLRMLHGEVPESIMSYNYGVLKDFKGEMAYCNIGPSLFDETHLHAIPGGFVDSWGVRFACNESTNFAPIPAPGSALLTVDDLDHWHDFIKVPKIPEDIDWEMVAKKDIEASGINRETTAAMCLVGIMPFQELIGMLGFEDCFMAFYEEPDAIKEILQAMVDVYLPICEAAVKYYHPDCAYLLDDTASAKSPFISLPMYEEFLLPVYRILTKPFRDEGIPLEHHNCGNCQVFLPHMIEELGVRVWDPAQPVNDLDAIRKKYGRHLTIAGGFNYIPPLDLSQVTRKVTDEMVHSVLDKYAMNGPFIASIGALGAYGDKEIMRINSMIVEELYFYGHGYYNYHPLDAFPEGTYKFDD